MLAASFEPGRREKAFWLAVAGVVIACVGASRCFSAFTGPPMFSPDGCWGLLGARRLVGLAQLLDEQGLRPLSARGAHREEVPQRTGTGAMGANQRLP